LLDCFSLRYWNEHAVAPREEYRPLQSLSLSIDLRLWGERPAGYHASALAVHAINATLVALVCGLLARRQAVGVMVGLLFAVYPFNTEAVAYIKNRGDLAACAFLLLALLPYARSEVPLGLGVPSAAAFVCALLAKTSAAVFPLLLWAILYWRKPPKGAEYGFAHVGAFFLLAAAALAGRMLLLAPGPRWETVFDDLSILERAWVVGRTYVSYVCGLVFPIHLCADRLLIPSSGRVALRLAWVLAAAWIGITVALRSRGGYPLVGLAMAWIAFALLPASNVKVLSSRPIAEQRAYVASIGFCLLLVQAMMVERRRTWASARVGLLFLTCAEFFALTAARNFAWKDEYTLWTDTVRKEWRNARPHHNLAAAYNRRGLYRRAIPELRRALRISPTFMDAYQSLGDAHRGLGQVDKALACYGRAIQLSPDAAYSWARIGSLLVHKKNYAEGEAALRKAVQIDPQNVLAYDALARLMKSTGREKQAQALLRRAREVYSSSSLFRFQHGNTP